MDPKISLCVVCAWRENCQKKFLKGKEITLKCPDFTRDLTIKDPEKPDGKKKDTGTDS